VNLVDVNVVDVNVVDVNVVDDARARPRLLAR
jgi:hypothetical protein